MIRAYSCRPVGAEWHVVAFAANARRARALAWRKSPSGPDGDLFIDWRARRLPEADGFCASEAVWIHTDDAPESARAAAAELWQELAA